MSVGKQSWVSLTKAKISYWSDLCVRDGRTLAKTLPFQTSCHDKLTVQLRAVNECAEQSHTCDVMATCSDTPKSYSCSCPENYDGNGVTSKMVPLGCVPNKEKMDNAECASCPVTGFTQEIGCQYEGTVVSGHKVIYYKECLEQCEAESSCGFVNFLPALTGTASDNCILKAFEGEPTTSCKDNDDIASRKCELSDKCNPQDCNKNDKLTGDYRGSLSFTKSGKKCENWTSQKTYTPENSPGKGLGNHNYCRDPSYSENNTGGAWCYTSENGT